MSLAAALTLAAAASASAPAPAQGSGAQVASAQAGAVIVEPAIVRQASGLEARPNGPAPQITRRDGAVLVEFQ